MISQFIRIATECGALQYGPRSWNISFTREAFEKFMIALGFTSDCKFKRGDRVIANLAFQATGTIVGYYSTDQVPMGYCVQFDWGPIITYPESVLTGVNESD